MRRKAIQQNNIRSFVQLSAAISACRNSRRVAHLCIAPFPRRVPHPCVCCKGGRRCCLRNSCPFYTARCVCRRRTRPFRLCEGRGTRIFGGFCSLKAGPPAPPTLRFPERTGVALCSDLAYDSHQNSNLLFRLGQLRNNCGNFIELLIP